MAKKNNGKVMRKIGKGHVMPIPEQAPTVPSAQDARLYAKLLNEYAEDPNALRVLVSYQPYQARLAQCHFTAEDGLRRLYLTKGIEKYLTPGQMKERASVLGLPSEPVPARSYNPRVSGSPRGSKAREGNNHRRSTLS